MASLRQVDRNQDWRVVSIEEVNPTQNYIEARDQYDTPLRLDLTNKPAFFQMPMPGEMWTVRRRGSDWLLDARIDNNEVTTPSTQMNPGDARIEAPGAIYVSGTNLTIGPPSPTTYVSTEITFPIDTK